MLAYPTQTALYVPVRTVVMQGSAGDRCPYADLTAAGLTIQVAGLSALRRSGRFPREDAHSAKENALPEADLAALCSENHPNYANPGLNISSLGTAGVITGVGGTTGGGGLDASGQRSLRMGMRVKW